MDHSLLRLQHSQGTSHLYTVHGILCVLWVADMNTVTEAGRPQSRNDKLWHLTLPPPATDFGVQVMNERLVKVAAQASLAAASQLTCFAAANSPAGSSLVPRQRGASAGSTAACALHPPESLACLLCHSADRLGDAMCPSWLSAVHQVGGSWRMPGGSAPPVQVRSTPPAAPHMCGTGLAAVCDDEPDDGCLADGACQLLRDRAA